MKGVLVVILTFFICGHPNDKVQSFIGYGMSTWDLTYDLHINYRPKIELKYL